MTNQLLFVPSGGLANRMRAVASAVNLCYQTDTPLTIIWFADWGLRAKFGDIFEPIDNNKVILREAKTIDKFLYDRARNKNFFLPRLPQLLMFADTIEEKQVGELNKQSFDYCEWLYSNKRCYMSCYHKFGVFSNYPSLVRELFVPRPEVTCIVEAYKSSFSNHTIGLHIRRTDNINSINHSPLQGFITAVDAEITIHPDTSVFLATDDDSVKRELFSRYGSRITTASDTADRNSLTGIKNAVAELWTLASTQRIYGSYDSSYSEMAAIFGGVDLIIVSKK